ALSRRYHGLPANKQTPEMLACLYEAQANDAYWHGLFGGLYLPHLRRAVYRAIIRLEALLDKVAERPQKVTGDLDLDGHDEVFLQNGDIQAILRLDGTASICEFDSYRLSHNFGDTLTRQAEHYHRKVHAQPEHGHDGEGIANPHERVSFKHEITVADLATDSYRKSLFCDSWLMPEGEAIRPSYRKPVIGKAVDFKAALRGGEIHKKIAIDDAALVVTYSFTRPPAGSFRVEINLAMPSCDGPAGRFRIGDNIPGGFGQTFKFGGLKSILLEDEVLGGAIQLSCSVPCAFSSQPHFSVSQSEAGFEKIMQAVTLELTWSGDMLSDRIEIRIEIL
ncbi:MAG TPA: alpha-amylase/4-alpha-glucanotransferase domain-containing protein, partial [Methylophilaceae bacterium]|nr:alpha-amylase/4-alpha-glucanotransferase domain-containing protein [Methylophilaceae bacterium]